MNVLSRSLVFAALAALAALTCAPAALADAPLPAKSVRVAAASDLAPAFADIDASFEKSMGIKVELSLGSTGLFARQIAEGAPYDLFAAASASYVDDVVKAGSCDGSTRAQYGEGRIVLWSAKSIGLGAPTMASLTDANVKKIAIANPEHAPYGAAAKEALVHAGIWDKVSSKIVYGENIQQTLQLAKSGNVEVAVVALSLAGSGDGAFTPVDAKLYTPIRQELVVCGKDPARVAIAKQLASFVTSKEGRAILAKYGFNSTP
jgi:molybdate transport system substrate-binding protein